MKRWWPAVLATVVATVVALPATPAAAHSTLVLTVNDDGRGSVSVDVLWADGHPVTDPLAGTLTAVSAAGAQVGPAALTRLPDQSTVVYEGQLRPGRWTVTVDLASPGIGHCAAPVTVATTAQPHSTRCGSVASPVAAPRADEKKDSPPWLLFGAAGAIVLATAAAVLVARRRGA